MIPVLLYNKINTLLHGGTDEFPTEIDHSDPMWDEVQLDMALNCYRGNHLKMEYIGETPREMEFIHELHQESKELERQIHECMETVLKNEGKSYTRGLRGQVETRLFRIQKGMEYGFRTRESGRKQQ